MERAEDGFWCPTGEHYLSAEKEAIAIAAESTDADGGTSPIGIDLDGGSKYVVILISKLHAQRYICTR